MEPKKMEAIKPQPLNQKQIFQQKMKAAQEKFDDRYDQAMKTTRISFLPSEGWLKIAKKAIEHGSIYSLKVSADELAAMYDATISTMTVFQYANFSNCLQEKSAHDLKLKIPAFLSLMKLTDAYVKMWVAQTTEIRKTVEDGINAEIEAINQQMLSSVSGNKNAEA